MIRSNQAGQAKNRPPRREEGENGNLQRFPIDVAEDLIILAEQQDFEEIIGNLFENALKWCDESVSISAVQNDNNNIVMIEDDGPGIPKESAKTVIMAGERLDVGKPGHGLGLSIASDLLQSYGQELVLDKSEKLGGLMVSFTFLNGKT
ncbi:ATP-binding protein [Profundibacter sp.]|uniref:ATP-binding protein n=1 Tax=Profundibacter sp. TaxID=3101071 RepID=UPI003D0DB418